MNPPPLIQDEIVVLGILMALLAFVFYTSKLENRFWKKFYVLLPTLLMCYLLPSILASFNIIAPEWQIADDQGKLLVDDLGNPVTQKLQLYFIATRLLLPAALILLILSIDFKSLFGLGKKALIMFFTATFGIIIGGPLAILIVSFFSPSTVGGEGADAVWRGMSTIAGSWIGGGANQAAMLEIYGYNQQKYAGMVLVDIVVANIWMAVLLFGIGKTEKIDKWLKADTSSIELLKNKVTAFTASIERIPTLKDYMVLLGIVFGGVSISYFGSIWIPKMLSALIPSIIDKSSMMSTFGDKFFWLVTLATIIGIILAHTKARNFEGIGASKLGSIFIYILVATIGMKMDLKSIVDNPGIIFVGLVWMTIHVLLLIIVAKWIRAPFFFLAVGSKANVGGAASAPIIAAAFHPSLASVGVLLAIFGYIIGTYGAIICTLLMEFVAN